MSRNRNYVLVEVDGNEVTETTVIGEAETEVIVLDFDSLETDEDAARDALDSLNDIALDDPTGKLTGYKDRLQSIVDEFEDEEDEFEEDEDDYLDDEFDKEDDDEEDEAEDEEEAVPAEEPPTVL